MPAARQRHQHGGQHDTGGRALRLSTISAVPLVRQKRLVPVLADHIDPQPMPIYAVTAGARHRLPKIKACMITGPTGSNATATHERTRPVPAPALRRRPASLLRHGAHLVALGFGSAWARWRRARPARCGPGWRFCCINFVWAPGDAQWGLIIATTFGLGWWASTLTAPHGRKPTRGRSSSTKWRPSGWCCGW